jgi:hypothetical protein
MKTNSHRIDPEEVVLAALTILGAIMLVIGIITMAGCASAPEVQVTAARCDVAHTDEIAAAVRCELEMVIEDELARATIETTLEDEPADRCIVGELRYGTWVLGGLFVHPVSAEECDGAPFGFGAADRPASTGAQSGQ